MTIRVDVDGGVMVADVLGPRSGPALLLLHGFTGDRTTWAPVAERLADRWRVVVPDLPGHGETTMHADASTMDGAAAALTIVLRAAAVGNVIPVGYSMGGRFALYAALRAGWSSSGLVLESASPGLRAATERAARRADDEARARDLDTRGIGPFVAEWEAQPLFAMQSDAVRRRLRAVRARASAAGLAASLRGMGTGSQPWLGDELPALACPVQLIVGEHDGKFRAIAERMRTACARASLTIVPDAGHAPHLERPEAFVAALTTFLEQQGGVECRSTG